MGHPKKILIAINFLAIGIFSLFPLKALYAQLLKDDSKLLNQFQETADSALYNTGSPGLYQTISNYTQIALGFVGILLLIYLIYAGYLWLTAGGNAEQVTKAKDHIRNAIIGLVIIMAAYIITIAVSRYAFQATSS